MVEKQSGFFNTHENSILEHQLVSMVDKSLYVYVNPT